MKTDFASYAKRGGKAVFFSICLLPLFWGWQSAYAQQLSLSLNLAPELRNAQILRVSDFNITGSGSVSTLFNLVITNSSAGVINALLRFELIGDRFPNTPIVVANTRPFPISPGSYTLTYQDIARGGDIDYNADAVQELTDAILQTGKLPAGNYTFILTVFDARQPNTLQDQESQTLRISSFTSLDLISPGAPVGNRECVEQFGLLPQFKWNSNADRFFMTVCEVLPSNSSPEEVMQNQPRLQQFVQRGSDFVGSPSLIYPSGGLPLQFGKTYYWQVQAIINSPSGEVRLPSEIWCFQISSINNPGGSASIQQLLNLLGSSDLAALFGEGGPLHGFKPTGVASMNSRRMELAELLNLLRNQSIKTLSVQIE